MFDIIKGIKVTEEHPMFPYIKNKYLHPIYKSYGVGSVKSVYDDFIRVEWSVPGWTFPHFIITSPDRLSKHLVETIPSLIRACECGANKVNASSHSRWCPLYE